MHDSQGYDSPSGGGGGNKSAYLVPIPPDYNFSNPLSGASHRGTKDVGITLKPDSLPCPYLNKYRASRIKSCTIAKGMTPLEACTTNGNVFLAEAGGGGGNTSNLPCPCPRRGTKDSCSTLKPDSPLCPYLNMHRAS